MFSSLKEKHHGLLLFAQLCGLLICSDKSSESRHPKLLANRVIRDQHIHLLVRDTPFVTLCGESLGSDRKLCELPSTEKEVPSLVTKTQLLISGHHPV